MVAASTMPSSESEPIEPLEVMATDCTSRTPLTITQTRGENTITSVYNLDGSESKNTMQGRGGPQESVSVAKWEGANLVITTKQQMGENTFETKRTLSLGADGVLTIELTRQGQDGQPMTSKVQYKK